MEYYLLLEHKLARSTVPFRYEWLVNGEWTENPQWTLALNDGLMDYGDYSILDQDRITSAMAEELILNGTAVIQGDIGFGTIYYESKTIQLSHWGKQAHTNNIDIRGKEPHRNYWQKLVQFFKTNPNKK